MAAETASCKNALGRSLTYAAAIFLHGGEDFPTIKHIHNKKKRFTHVKNDPDGRRCVGMSSLPFCTLKWYGTECCRIEPMSTTTLKIVEVAAIIDVWHDAHYARKTVL